MVTTTHDDDQPTHDVYGTDLKRVRAMLDRGFSVQLIAGCLAIDFERAHYAVLVATGDRQGAPTPEEMAEECRRIQDGWTPEQAVAAKRGELRTSSITVRPGGCTAEEAKRRSYIGMLRRQAKRIESGSLPITFHPTWHSSRRYQLRIYLRGKCTTRVFETHEEAEAWGRAWLKKVNDEQLAEAGCFGK